MRREKMTCDSNKCLIKFVHLAYFCPIKPLAIEFMSGLIYGLIACELSHDGICVEPGDTTLLDNRFVSLSSSVCKSKHIHMKMSTFRFRIMDILWNSNKCICNVQCTTCINSNGFFSLFHKQLYLNISRTDSMNRFPISVRIDHDLFNRGCSQCIQNCPNILINFKSFGQRWFTAQREHIYTIMKWIFKWFHHFESILLVSTYLHTGHRQLPRSQFNCK